MAGGLIAKTTRETWLSTLLFALALGAFQAFATYILPKFDEELLEQWLEIEFLQGMFDAMLGTEVGSAIGPGMIASVLWVHPMTLTLIWAHGIMFCTRLPAGEVDRGTIDVLLSLPVSRTRVYLCESVVWLVSGLVITATGLLGNIVGNWAAMSETQGSTGHTIIILVNLFCLYTAVGAMACLASSLSDRRGRAVAIVFALVSASYLLSFFAQYWHVARSVSFLSLQHYYKPLLILRETTWPVKDILVLAAVTIVLWLAGAIIFARRNICTV